MQIECQIHTHAHTSVKFLTSIYFGHDFYPKYLETQPKQKSSKHVHTRTHFFHHLSISHRWCHEKRINLLTWNPLLSILCCEISEYTYRNHWKLRSISVCNRGRNLHSHLNLEIENTTLIFWKGYMLFDLLSICPVLVCLCVWACTKSFTFLSRLIWLCRW